jgi:hypothetical protein
MNLQNTTPGCDESVVIDIPGGEAAQLTDTCAELIVSIETSGSDARQVSRRPQRLRPIWKSIADSIV